VEQAAVPDVRIPSNATAGSSLVMGPSWHTQDIRHMTGLGLNSRLDECNFPSGSLWRAPAS
jgi:hypothetical protein